MTGLEALKIVERDCEDLEQVPYGEFALIEKSLKALEAIKKYFIFKFDKEEDSGGVWALLVSIQAKEDEGTWDTTASTNIVDHEEDFEILKEVLGNERN